ncbi:hypothetical protein PO909_031811, partial [Leuciscus waleckii]
CQFVNRVLGKNLLLLRELNLSECELNRPSGLKKLAAVLQDKHCKLNTLMFNCISITAEGCSVLASAFNSNPSNLKELELSENKLGNSGVTEISTLLGNSQCTLQILRLSDCSITEEGYKALASALRSNPSHLIELDLTGNDPGQSGVKELSDLLQDQNCQLKTLRFLGPAADEACQYVSGIVGENPLLLRELNLSERELGDTRVNQIAALLKDKHCKLNTLMLNNNSITAEGCAALTSAFNSNPSNLIELDLSENKLGNSGMKKICELLENTQCSLEKLKLSDCNISEEGYKALVSTLRSNPLHLIELDLRGNDPGQSGVKELSDVLKDVHYRLKTIRFLKSAAAQEACDYLTKVLGKSPLLLTELDLSEDILGDLDGEKLSALLMDSHSKVEKIKLNNCELTEKSCSVLATVLSSKTILKELNLNNSRLLNSGVKEICEGLKNPVCELKILKVSNCSITEGGYKALASALRSNPSHLIELDLRGNDPGQSGVKELNDLLQDQNCQLKTLRFLSHDADEACQYVRGIVGKNPLLLRELNLSKRELGDTGVNQIAALLKDKHCKLNTLMLRKCGLTEESCSALATVLRSNSSLKELDISNNNLQDSGVKKLQNGLENTNCTLEKLRLSNCSISEEGYKALASALRSNPSHLIELDLRGNDPGQSGVKELSDLLQDQNCQLKTLRFLGPAADEACQYVRGIVGKNPLLLRELNLSERELRDTRVNQIAALLKDKHCKLNTLMLSKCDLTEESCSALASVLSSDSNLKDLDLSNNNLQDSGVKLLSDGLKENCKLERLRVSNCSITEGGYKALASALRSNPSHLIELDLTGNDPGQSGVKELSDLLQDQNCQLKTLRFLGPAADEACQYVRGIVGKNPLLLRELNLSRRELGDTGVNQIAALLKDKHCKLNTLMLNNCELTEKSCSVLATVLSSKTILKELNLNNSRLLNSGVKEICKGLKNPVCELKILKLSDCSITEEGYKALASALRSNPSHLIELDLRGNDPGQSGVKELDDLLQDQKCSLKTLRLLQSPDADEACKYLTEDFYIKNPLLLRELNLSERELGDTRVNQIAALLKDKHCKLNTLILSDCSITEEGYKALASALRSNPSHLIELDLRGNDPGQSGVKELYDLLQDQKYQLKTLRFLSPTADKAFQYVRGIVGKNLLLLRELNLSKRELRDTLVNQIAALLQDKHCKLNTLM